MCFVVPSSHRLIVVEKTGRWAAALRRVAGRGALPLTEVRSLDQTERELGGHPAALVAIEVGVSSLVRVSSRLALWRNRFAGARFLLLAEPELAPLESALRDAGAVHVIYSTRELAATVRLIRRQLARTPQSAMTLEESIWARLPWSAASSP